jgi:hypothetical protein
MKKFRTQEDKRFCPKRIIPKTSALMRFTHSLFVGMFFVTWGLIVCLNLRMLVE